LIKYDPYTYVNAFTITARAPINCLRWFAYGANS